MQYNYEQAKRLAGLYLKGKDLTIKQKQQLRDAFNALYQYQAEQELFLVVESLKKTKQKAFQANQFDVVISCDSKLSIIFRDKLKVETVNEFKTEQKCDSQIRHLRQLYPNLSDDSQIAKAAARQIAAGRIKNTQ